MSKSPALADEQAGIDIERKLGINLSKPKQAPVRLKPWLGVAPELAPNEWGSRKLVSRPGIEPGTY